MVDCCFLWAVLHVAPLTFMYRKSYGVGWWRFSTFHATITLSTEKNNSSPFFVTDRSHDQGLFMLVAGPLRRGETGTKYWGLCCGEGLSQGCFTFRANGIGQDRVEWAWPPARLRWGSPLALPFPGSARQLSGLGERNKDGCLPAVLAHLALPHIPRTRRGGRELEASKLLFQGVGQEDLPLPFASSESW